MFKVFIKEKDSSFRDKKVFNNPFEAEEYFNELCKERTDTPAAAVLTTGNLERKRFRIDSQYPDDARLISNESML